MSRISSVIIIFMIFIMTVIVWIWYRDTQDIIMWWNRRIKGECDKQDHSLINGIPSYQNAWECSSKTALDFHRLIQLNHDDILREVIEMISRGNLSNNIGNEKEWNPIWIRMMGDWIESSNELSTLKRVVSLFPDIPNLYVSIFYPGMILIENKNRCRLFHRYHYGLKVNQNDIGFKLAGFDIKWKEKEGFIWDNTIPHSAWNHTSEPRIIIFADIIRELSPINALGSRAIYHILKRNNTMT